jgi:hypothetical protein
MKINCEVIIKCEGERKINDIMKSVDVDNYNFVKTKKKGNSLIAEIDSTSISSMIHTLDDYLACITVAKKIVDKD